LNHDHKILFPNQIIFAPFRNLGQNRFAHLPHQGLKTLVELKAHNNPNLKDFPAAQVISVPRFFLR
jgi:hypothetical protein